MDEAEKEYEGAGRGRRAMVFGEGVGAISGSSSPRSATPPQASTLLLSYPRVRSPDNLVISDPPPLLDSTNSVRPFPKR
eukprot:762662-Hanusia_phi.AAC.1